MKINISKIIGHILAIGIISFGFWICDGTIWKEIILALFVLMGGKIINEN